MTNINNHDLKLIVIHTHTYTYVLALCLYIIHTGLSKFLEGIVNRLLDLSNSVFYHQYFKVWHIEISEKHSETQQTAHFSVSCIIQGLVI